MINIYQGDCLQLMRNIPDGSVDFICVDLPYGITNCEWDKRLDFSQMWEQFNRVGKENVCVALFAKSKFLIELAYSNLKNYRYKIVVLKEKAVGFLNAKKIPLQIHEDILVFYKKLPTYNPQFTCGKPYIRTCRGNYGQCYGKKKPCVAENYGERYPLDVVKFNVGKKIHPTQKSVDLLEYLIKTYTNKGEVVLDCCMGSGTTAVAAINTNRSFIGFELDEKYFEIAKTRIKQAQEQKDQALF